MEWKYIILCFAIIYTLCLLGIYQFHIEIPFILFSKSGSFRNNSIDSFMKIYPESNFSFSETFLLPSKNLWRPTNTSDPIQSDRLIDQYAWIEYLSNYLEHTKQFTTKRIILFDTGIMSSNASRHIQCPGYELKLCDVTKSEDLENPYDLVGNFDAAVFAFVHRPNNNITNLVLPKHVKQVIHTEENPYKRKVDFSLNNAISATYSFGSDIVIPYGKWIPYDDSIKTSTLFSNRNNLPSNKKNFATDKMGGAVIFVSNCRHIKNNRMGFVKVLQKYMKVDVYGKCGTLEMDCTEMELKETCMSKTIKRYKYYLAFENANCRDYITEKLYKNAIRNDVVPVVLGAHPDDYKRELPPHSYIHVEDFDSPKQLAEYLNILNTNDDLYNKYFEWKGTGEFHPARNFYLCRICGMLFYSDYVSHPVWNRAHSTWKDNNKCLGQNQWYWNNKTL